MKSTIIAFSVAFAIAASAQAGTVGGDHPQDTNSSAVWTFPDEVLDDLTAQVQVDATAMAILITDSLDGADLTLTQQAVVFSGATPGPGPQVGEVVAGNFITGTELITVTAPAFGTYNFDARYNVVLSGGGSNEQSSPFSITFRAGTPVIPEPASFALCGLAVVGLAGLRRRR